MDMSEQEGLLASAVALLHVQMEKLGPGVRQGVDLESHSTLQTRTKA